MKLGTLCWLSTLAVVFGLVQVANAEIMITELRTKSQFDPEDYFELTNTGAAAVDITGWKFDDESADLAEAAALEGITSIVPGESVVFFQLATADAAADETVFRDAWGGLSGVQVGYYDGAGLGKGDTINLFDAGDNLVLTLEYGVSSPEETHAGDWAAGNFDGSDTYENQSAVWVPGSDPQQFVLAAPGVLGSFADSMGDYGSPGSVGAVPEPATCLLAGLALAGLVAVRKRLA